MVDFDINKIQQYIDNYQNKTLKQTGSCGVYRFMTDATIFFFDKNKDGIVTREEFKKASKEEYSIWTRQLAEYNSTQKRPEHIFSFDEIESSFGDGFITGENLESKPKSYIKSDSTLQENKNLKNIHQMTAQEIEKEAKEYGVSVDEFINNFETLRKERNKYDEHSNEIDFHIGTFNQGKIKDCTVLARIENLSDDELKQMIQKKEDSKGNVYYDVTFDGKHHVKITQQELDNSALKYKGREIVGFSQGDADVKLLEMAYAKTFGKTFELEGAYTDETLNNFSGRKDATYTLDINENQLMNNSIKIVGLTNSDVLNDRGYSDEGEFLMESGNKVKLYNDAHGSNVTNSKRLKLPDGTVIAGGHAYTVKEYNPETKTLILKNPEENSTDILVPFEALKFFIGYSVNN